MNGLCLTAKVFSANFLAVPTLPMFSPGKVWLFTVYTTLAKETSSNHGTFSIF